MGRIFDDLDDLAQEQTLPGEEEPRVLVAVMNDPRALGIARTQRWYRIPVRRAPPRVGADYLAFYQTAAFGPQERWRINYYAPIRRYRLVQRCELLPEEKDHPRAQDKYYKLEIGPLEPLPHPIPSRRLRRVTFIPTTLTRLLNASEINDLWLGGKLEEELWASLKKENLAAERQVSVGEETENYRVDFALYCHDGRVAILCQDQDFGDIHVIRESSAITDYDLAAAGWKILRLKPQSPENWPQQAVNEIRQLVQGLGGLAD